ncbi:hypothetical protein JTB14_019361 [Gonioctena quinquepunctata]|nr:hypothetical protein JTB14_019361 [Gonioctena quinquepunctata]
MFLANCESSLLQQILLDVKVKVNQEKGWHPKQEEETSQSWYEKAMADAIETVRERKGFLKASETYVVTKTTYTFIKNRTSFTKAL